MATRTALEVAQEHGDQTGKVFLVTGAYSGIGVETTQALFATGGTVIAAGRNEKQQQEFVESLKKVHDDALIDGGKTLDLSDLSSIKAFATYVLGKYDKLDCLILNAGVMMSPAGTTKDGLETQLGVNVVGHFLLAKLLLPLVQQAKGRQVWLSSSAHPGYGGNPVNIEYYRNFDPKTSPYDPQVQYQQSKLGDVLLAKEMGKRHGVEAVSVHPASFAQTWHDTCRHSS